MENTHRSFLRVSTLKQWKKAFWLLFHLVVRKMWQRRVPGMRQLSAVECGAACLAMILSYYGCKIRISEIRDYYGIGRDGLTALSLVQAARHFGLLVSALSLQKNDFQGIPLPAIAHWKGNHFLIVEHWSPKGVIVVDPAVGRRYLSAEVFAAAFTGIVIALKPGTRFVHRSARPRMRLRTYVSRSMKHTAGLLVQVIGVSLLLQIFGLGIPLFTKVVVDQIIPFRMRDALPLLGMGMLILLLSYMAATFLRAYVLVSLQARADTQMMLSFFQHLLSLPLCFFQQRSSGDILTRLTSNTVLREMMSNQFIATLLDATLVTTYLLILFWQAPSFATLVLALGLLQVVLPLCTNRALRHLADQELEAQGKSYGYAAEVVVGIATLKAVGAQEHAFERWSKLFTDQLHLSIRRRYLSSLIDTIMSTLRICSPLVLLLLGTIQVIDGLVQLGTMLALNALAITFLAPLASLIGSGQKMQFMFSHLQRIADVLEAEPEQDLQNVQPPPRLTGQIMLKHVSFQYALSTPVILQDIHVQIEAGQKVAIVGRTGSGKSTLGKLLLGLYPPTEGAILYDTIALSSMNYQALRSQFGAVLQESYIFSGSIKENIAFHRPDVGMDQIIKAAQMAALHDDLLEMPMRYETFVAEQGGVLSGGQRQRLALARAFVSNPAILLLDEATSHLDVMTEQLIQQNINALACTRLIIAHRLSTIQDADLILVLDQGALVEQGTHTELLMKNGYYARLIQSQLTHKECEGVEHV